MRLDSEGWSPQVCIDSLTVHRENLRISSTVRQKHAQGHQPYSTYLPHAQHHVEKEAAAKKKQPSAFHPVPNDPSLQRNKPRGTSLQLSISHIQHREIQSRERKNRAFLFDSP